MDIEEKRSLNRNELHQLMLLWNAEYPEQIRYHDVEELNEYLEKVNPDMHFLLLSQARICGWMILFQRQQSTWFAMIVSSAMQGKGYGSLLLDRAKERAKFLQGWVVDSQAYSRMDGNPYRSPLAFYLKNGFEPCPDSRLEYDKVSAVKVRWRSSS